MKNLIELLTFVLETFDASKIYGTNFGEFKSNRDELNSCNF
jgi:hypothetical protein